MNNNYHTVQLKLADRVAESGLSKTKICQRAEVTHKLLKSYCENTVQRVDLNVLGRICTVLECDIGDLFVLISQDGDEINGAETKNKYSK
jgi:putative transcriptional regulator